ncbi:MAG: hypothetical protein WDZ76_06535 [Pseudohongiellaceae bacterium]
MKTPSESYPRSWRDVNQKDGAPLCLPGRELCTDWEQWVFQDKTLE